MKLFHLKDPSYCRLLHVSLFFTGSTQKLNNIFVIFSCKKMKEQVRHPDQFTLISYFFWSVIDRRIIFSCRSTSLECCWRDEILPVESHLLLLSVVLFVPYFSSSISRARRLFILCFAVSDWWPLSTCLYRRDIGTLSVFFVCHPCPLLPYFRLFLWE